MQDAKTVQQIVIHALVPSVERMVVIVHAVLKRMVPDVRKSVTDAKTVRQVAIHALAQNATKKDAAAIVAQHQQLNQTRHAARQPDAVRTNDTVLITRIGKSASKLA